VAARKASNRRNRTLEKQPLTLEIKGMTCDGCAETVKRYLKQVDGVLEAAVDWDSGRGEVVYDPTKTDEETILNSPAFRRHYSARPVNTDDWG
jgi:copper chaperone CopZ